MRAVRTLLALSLTLGAIVATSPSASAATVPAAFSQITIGGFDAPSAMEVTSDGRVFVSQQGGQLRVVRDNTLLATPFVSLNVDSSGERGLLGVTVAPGFPAVNRVYAYYTVPGSPAHNRVSWWAASGDVASGPEHVILDLPGLSSATNHNGGGLHVGPDGQLYVSVGENANAIQAQSLANPFGKILRIDSLTGAASPGNPFEGVGGADTRIWAYGLRNPYTFAFDPGVGGLFINDVGASTYEEIDFGQAGANYGWPCREGAHVNTGCTPTGGSSVDPIYEYDHSAGACAITGGVFYRPPIQSFPAGYRGVYFFGDLCAGWVHFRTPAGDVGTFATNAGSPVDLRVTDAGQLLILDNNGALTRVSGPPPPANAIYLSDNQASGVANTSFIYGEKGDDVLFCDWNGNGTDTVGVHRGNQWLLHNGNDGGPPDISVQFGDPGDRPLCGDWDGNGNDTIGVQRGSRFYLTNDDFTAGVPYVFGDPGDVAVVGDWDGNSSDNLGVHRGNVFFLANANNSGTLYAIPFGNPTDQPLAGSWSGGGTQDTIGVKRGNVFYLTWNDISAHTVVAFGNPTDIGVSGNFDGAGAAGIGVVR